MTDRRARSRYPNVEDDALKTGLPADDTDPLNLLHAQRLLAEGLEHEGVTGDGQTVHGHCHGDMTDKSGVVRRRTIFNDYFPDVYGYSVNTSFSELFHVRTQVGPSSGVFVELCFYCANAMQFKVEYNPDLGHEWSADYNRIATSCIEEIDSTTELTANWHTLDGRVYIRGMENDDGSTIETTDWANLNKGKNTKLLPLHGPTAHSSTGDMLKPGEFVFYGKSTASTTVYIVGVQISELLAGDEGVFIL